MRFEKFSFGSIRIDGVTYEHDVIIDHGHVRKRKKEPFQKVPRLLRPHAALHRRGHPLEMPSARHRHRNRRTARDE
jgi:hypothetical protein